VQRRDSPLWLRELDDDGDDSQFPFLAFSAFPPSPVWPGAWRSGRALDRLATPKSRVRLPVSRFQVTTLGNLFTHTCVPLSPSSIIRYQSRGGDALRLGR